jgi:hypothetical protein
MARVADGDASAAIEYRVVGRPGLASFELTKQGQPLVEATSLDDLLFYLEKDLTIELQKRRPDLFFLHSGAVERNGKAFLLTAESGFGKSTTTWGLLHHGFQYLSDELSPIDLTRMEVWAYPHALCLKRRPPHYPLPEATIDLGTTLHVPVFQLPTAAIHDARALGGVFLVDYSPDRSVPELREVGSSEAAARLYVSTLNALAHDNFGLEGVARLAQNLPCFAVDAADLAATCHLIRNKVDQLAAAA